MHRRAGNKRGFLRAVLAVLPLLLGSTGAGGESLTWEGVVGEALRHSSRIGVKSEEILIHEASRKQSLSVLFPAVSVGGRVERFERLDRRDSLGTIHGEVIGGLQSEWRSSVYLLGEYTLSNWLKKRHESLYYERLGEASVQDRDAERKRIALEVTDLFGSLVEGSVRVGYLDRMIGKMKESLSLRSESYAAGEISYEDLVRAEVQVVELEKERADAHRQFRETLERLTAFTGREYGDVSVEAMSPADARIEGTAGPAIPERVVDSPEFRARQKELDAARERERGAGNNRLPDVSIYGRYDLYGRNPEVSDALRDIEKTSYNAGFFISLPVFDGGLRKWERERTRREVRKQEALLRATKDEKRKDSASLLARMRELDRSLDRFRRLESRYRKLLAIAAAAEALGARSRAEILEGEKDALAVYRDLKVLETQRAVAGRKYRFETDFDAAMEPFGWKPD